MCIIYTVSHVITVKLPWNSMRKELVQWASHLGAFGPKVSSNFISVFKPFRVAPFVCEMVGFTCAEVCALLFMFLCINYKRVFCLSVQSIKHHFVFVFHS